MQCKKSECSFWSINRIEILRHWRQFPNEIGTIDTLNMTKNNNNKNFVEKKKREFLLFFFFFWSLLVSIIGTNLNFFFVQHNYYMIWFEGWLHLISSNIFLFNCVVYSATSRTTCVCNFCLMYIVFLLFGFLRLFWWNGMWIWLRQIHTQEKNCLVSREPN